MEFREWLRLREVGTSSACVAGFQRQVLPMVRRGWLGPWGEEDPFFRKRKRRGRKSG